MALVKRGQVWWIDLNTGREPGGRLRVSTRTGDKKVASILHAEAHKALLLGGPLPGAVRPKVTLGDAVERALRLDLKGLKSGRTIGHHLDRIYDAIPPTTALADVNVAAVDRLVAALEGRGNAPTTINRTMQTLGRVLKLAQGWHMIDRVPALPRFTEPDSHRHVYTPAEEQAMIAHFGAASPMGTLVVLLSDTGLRLGEALAYDRMLLAPGALRVWGTKNGDARTVPLTARAQDAAMRWLESRPFATKDQIEWRWRSMRLALFPGNDGAVIHALRHTCITRLVRAGMPLAKVMAWAGHKDYKTTLRYTQLVPGDLTEGAAMLERMGNP